MADLASLGGFLKQATAEFLPPNAERQFAAFARKCLAEAIASGFGTQQYDRIVNGRFDALEETVKLPGRITYIFHSWATVVPMALAELRNRVPRKTGNYANSFIVVVNGRRVTNYGDIPANSEVWILNSQPYTRRMESGGNKTGKRHFERAKQAINGKLRGTYSADLVFQNITSGLDEKIPYILRTNGPSLAAKSNRRSSVYRAGGTVLKNRKDRAAGQPISYPTLVLTTAK